MEFGQPKDPKRRLFGLGFVVVLHILLIWGLVSGLARKAVELLPAPIETKIVEEASVDEEPPPPPPPEFEPPPPPFIPPPEINIAATPAAGATAITTVTNKVAPKPAPKAAPKVTAPVVKAKACKEPDYPAVSERLGEAGTVLLQLLVGVNGKVTESKIEKSSGFPRLDAAAQKALSRCTFTPGTTDGKPTPGWAQIKYTFKQRK